MEATRLKRCGMCKEHKPLESFSTNKGRRGDGRCYRCKPCSTIYQRERVRKNPERERELNRRCRLKRVFGLTPDQYDSMLFGQGGGCAICGRQPPGDDSFHKYLAVDHCHKTGAVRGLLCTQCNTAIGLFAEDSSRLLHAAAYLMRHGAQS